MAGTLTSHYDTQAPTTDPRALSEHVLRRLNEDNAISKLPGWQPWRR
jgi:hypothetical protein